MIKAKKSLGSQCQCHLGRGDGDRENLGEDFPSDFWNKATIVKIMAEF